jgi:sugar phosphate permease
MGFIGFHIFALVGSLIFLIQPLAAKNWGAYYFLASRAIQGVIMVDLHSLTPSKIYQLKMSTFSKGPLISGTMAMLSNWIPANERGSLVAFVWTGNTLGTVITLPLSGLLAEYVNWESTFYVFGGVGILFSILWYFFVHSTSADDPRITKVIMY